MISRFGMRVSTLLAGGVAAALLGLGAGPAAQAAVETEQKALLKGSTTASYYWDDSSGRAGDTGLPASGKPMQKGMAASPSWPLHTEGYVTYNGKKADFFVGDRGPGNPSNRGIMLDLDAKTFADLTGGTFNPDTLGVDGNGGKGHIKVEYTITKWGEGVGKKDHPVPFSTGAWSKMDHNPATPPEVAPVEKPEVVELDNAKTEKVAELKKDQVAEAAAFSEDGDGGAKAMLAMAGGLAVAGGVFLGGDRLRRRLKRSS